MCMVGKKMLFYKLDFAVRKFDIVMEQPQFYSSF